MRNTAGGGVGNWVWFVCAAQLPLMLVYANYPAALPIIKGEWGLTNAEAGTIYSAFYFGYVFSSFLLATATDYVSARTIYLASALWLAVANLLFAVLADGFWSGAVFRALTGIGLAGIYASGLRLLAENVRKDWRARAVGVNAFFFTLGIAASMYVTGVLVSNLGWRLGIALTSVGPAAGYVLMFFALPPLPSPAGGGKRAFEFPRLPFPLWVAITTSVLHRWEVFAFRGWAVTFFAAALMVSGVEGKEAAVGLGASAAAAVIALSSVSKLIGGWSADRFGRVRTIGVSLLWSGTLALFMGKAFSLPYPALLAVSLLWVVMIHVDAPVLIVLVTELAPRRHLGSAIGFQSGFSFLIGSLSPMVVGVFLDLANPGRREGALPVHWGWAFAVPGIGALLGAACCLWLGRLMRRRERGAGAGPAA